MAIAGPVCLSPLVPGTFGTILDGGHGRCVNQAPDAATLVDGINHVLGTRDATIVRISPTVTRGVGLVVCGVAKHCSDMEDTDAPGKCSVVTARDEQVTVLNNFDAGQLRKVLDSILAAPRRRVAEAGTDLPAGAGSGNGR